MNICYDLAPTEQISITTFNIIIATANHIIPEVNPIFVNKAHAAKIRPTTLRWSGFGSQRLDAHDLHQAANMTLRGFRSCEIIGKGATAHPGMLHVELVDFAD